MDFPLPLSRQKKNKNVKRLQHNIMPPGCSLQADNSFGPAIDPRCRDGFDFTLLFEQAILGLVPAVAFLLVCPLRLRLLVKRDVRTHPHIMRLAKLVSNLTSPYSQSETRGNVDFTSDNRLDFRRDSTCLAYQLGKGNSAKYKGLCGIKCNKFGSGNGNCRLDVGGR